jgi:hypothetical protein
VGELRLSARVENPANGNIASIDSGFSDIVIPGRPGRQVVEVRLPAVPLLPGAYNFKLLLQERESLKPFVRWLNAVPFRVGDRGDSKPRFLLTLRDRWRELDPAEAAGESWDS